MAFIHELKIWPEYFTDVKCGDKTFEIRKLENHGFEVGDKINLREWCPNGKEYSGDECQAWINYICDITEVMGLTEPTIAMSIRLVTDT